MQDFASDDSDAAVPGAQLCEPLKTGCILEPKRLGLKSLLFCLVTVTLGNLYNSESLAFLVDKWSNYLPRALL